MSDREINDILRFFANIKNHLKKYVANNDFCVKAVVNKVIILGNVFETQYIVKRLRKVIPQDIHPQLNTLLLERGMIKFDPDVPYCVTFYKKLKGI